MKFIISNYSKAIDGRLLLDDTNKVTKKPAIDAGSYVKPDFTVYLKLMQDSIKRMYTPVSIIDTGGNG